MKHGNHVEFKAFNQSGLEVDSHSADSTMENQTIILSSPEGIHRVDFLGSEICLVQICWFCKGGDINPLCPKEVIDEAYRRGYEAGLAAAGGENMNGGACATYNFFTSTLHIPCLQVDGVEGGSYWMDLKLTDSVNMFLQMTGFGVNDPVVTPPMAR